MDFTVALESVTVIEVVAAAIAGMLLGAVWYSQAVFGKRWMKVAGLREADVQSQDMTRTMTIAFIKTLVIAFVLALVLVDVDGVVDGASTGAVLGAGLVGVSLGVLYLFECKSKDLWLINGGYVTVNLALMGGVIAWL